MQGYVQVDGYDKVKIKLWRDNEVYCDVIATRSSRVRNCKAIVKDERKAYVAELVKRVHPDRATDWLIEEVTEGQGRLHWLLKAALSIVGLRGPGAFVLRPNGDIG